MMISEIYEHFWPLVDRAGINSGLITFVPGRLRQMILHDDSVLKRLRRLKGRLRQSSSVILLDTKKATAAESRLRQGYCG
jgi:hypothetical protein